MKFHPCLRLAFTLLLASAFGPNLHAGWGSIRASNHSSAPAPRPQAPVNRSPQIRQAPAQVTRPEARPENPAPAQVMCPENRPAPVQQPRPVAVESARADQADRQRMDIAPERSQSAYWSGYRPGMTMGRLPDGWRRIGIRGHDYFYFGGIFYDTGPAGYVVIAPPVDADIPELPPDTETVVVGNTVYYYAAGAFYLQQPDGSFIVVAAPIGAVVSLLPPDAVPVIINGTTYYLADGVYYQPIMEDGAVAYLVVPQPNS